MNIYFSCAITGGRQDEEAYRVIVESLLADGHEVPTAVLSSAEVLNLEAVVSPKDVFHRDIAWLDGCDAVVAEVSTPSHGVGYEVAYALGLGKPVLCCYRAGRRVSKMITGNTQAGMHLLEYEDSQGLSAGVREFISSLNNRL
jgi:nucleoside 2-deoxyribosyltransferase